MTRAVWLARPLTATVVAGGVALCLGAVVAGAVSTGVPAILLLLAATLGSFVVIVIGNLRLALLALAVLDIPFQFDKNLYYDADAAALGAIGGLPLSLTSFALAGLYALWLAELLAGTKEVRFKSLRPALPLVVYIAFTALSLAAAQDRELAAFGLAQLGQMLLLYVYVLGTVRRREEIRFIVIVLLAGLALESLVMIAMYQTGYDLSSLGLPGQRTALPGVEAGDSRLGGTIGSPNVAASYLALLLALAAALLAAPLNRWFRSFVLFAFTVGAIALVFTYSRAGWIAFAVSIGFLLVVVGRGRVVSRRVLFATVVGIVLLAVPYHDAISDRLLGSTRGGAYAENARIPLLRLAWRMVEDNPALGVGANNFAVSISEYAGSEFAGEWLNSVHNRYLLVWAETGIGALLAFLWFLAETLRRGWQCWSAKVDFISPAALGITSAVLATATVTMSLQKFAGRPQLQLLVLLASLLAAMQSVIRHERSDPIAA